MRSRTLLLTTLVLLWILTAFIEVPMVQSSPETYGPRLNDLWARFIMGTAAQNFALTTAAVDAWFDIYDPTIVTALSGAGYTMIPTKLNFQFYYFAFNMRDQENPSGGGIPWRVGTGTPAYYTYWGAPYSGYVPLDEQAFRHACAHLVPKNAIEAFVYGGVTGNAIDSTVPPAQRYCHKPDVDGHPYNPGDPVASVPGDGTACGILKEAGYVWEPLAPNPAPKQSPTDPNGNWLDPHTALLVDDPLTPWDDTVGSPMNHITFAGLPLGTFPESWARDDMCTGEFRAIGLPIQHVAVVFTVLLNMMNVHQFDMYAAGWKVGRWCDHLYGFFHSSQDMIEGYNTPGIHDNDLDALLEIIQYETDRGIVRTACFDAQDMIAEKLPYIVTIGGKPFGAFADAITASHTDTLKGIVNSPGYGPENDWTFYELHWASMETPGNPLGIGGTANYIVGSAPTNYHPGYASTTDEWNVIGRLFDGLINVNPYTHEDITWLALDWTVEPWTDPQTGTGMNTTFRLRDDIYWHDGVHYNAISAFWSLEFARDQQIARAFPMWQHLVDIEVHDEYTFSVYHDATSLWTFYHVAGPDVWQVDDAACWATMFPKHCYEGTGPFFRPEATPNPTNPSLTCLIGTGPFVYVGGNLVLGGWAHLAAYRPGPSPVTTSWFMSVEEEDALVTDMFHWIGDVGGDTLYNPGSVPPQEPPDGDIDIYDLANAGKSYGLVEGEWGYNPMADIAPEPTYHTRDGLVDMRDVAELCKNWGKQRKYP